MSVMVTICLVFVKHIKQNFIEVHINLKYIENGFNPLISNLTVLGFL